MDSDMLSVAPRRREMEAPYDPNDWLGPWRGYIRVLSQGPVGRAKLAAEGIPPEEIPPEPPRNLVRAQEFE